MRVSKSKTATAIRKEFEGAITEIGANKTLNPRDPYNEGFNAGMDMAIKMVQRYIKGEGLFQLQIGRNRMNSGGGSECTTVCKNCGKPVFYKPNIWLHVDSAYFPGDGRWSCRPEVSQTTYAEPIAGEAR